MISTLDDDNEELFEEWSHEQLRKRSQELQLIDISGKYALPVANISCHRSETIERNFLTTEEVLIGEFDNVSASTTSDSQVISNHNLIHIETKFIISNDSKKDKMWKTYHSISFE